MKYFPLTWSATFRSKTRTFMHLLSVLASLSLIHI